MARIMIALSSDPTSTTHLLVALSIMAFSLADGEDKHDIGKLGLKDLFKRSMVDGRPALERWSSVRAFTPILNRFQKSWVCDGEMAADLAAVMKAAGNRVKADNTGVTAEQLTLWNKLRIHFTKDSESAWKYIALNVKQLKSPTLSAAFLSVFEDVTQVDVSGVNVKRMKALTAKLSGRQNDAIMTPIEVSKYVDTYPKAVAEYRTLYKNFNTAFKYELKKFVRASGKDRVDVKVAAKYLETLGLNNIAKGFVGSIDEDAKYYTRQGHQLNATVVGTVVMNPSYDEKADNTYVCRTIATNKNGRPQEWRTLHFLSAKAQDRFGAVRTMADNVKSHRKQWAADLKCGDPKVEAMAALVEVAYSTLARVGGEGNKTEDGEPTYGLSTLLVEHVKVDSAGAHFNYKGKKGTEQPATLFPRGPIEKRAIQIIKRLITGKRKTDRVFTYNGRPIRAGEVNSYLKSLGVPAKFTIHKFRHLAGTQMFLDVIKDCPFKKGGPKTTQSNVERWYKQATLPIGVALHHRTGEKVTSMTALGAYVDFGIQRDFFKDLGLREPNFLRKKNAA